VSNEYLAAAGLRAPLAKVRDDRFRNSAWQRHDINAAGLAVDLHGALNPVDFIQRHPCNLGATQPKVDETAQNRIVTTSGTLGTITGLK
jgi:hypothetical protein